MRATLATREGPRDRWRTLEDEMTARGCTLDFEAARKLGVEEEWIMMWEGGIELDLIEGLQVAKLKNYPMDQEKRLAGGAELDRLHDLNKIFWYEENDVPDDLGICPLSVILKKDKTRVVHDWSNPKYQLNAFLENRDVDYGTLDGWVALLKKNGYMGGLDVKDCFLHWPMAPKHRRLLGVEHPVNGKKGCYLFLPFGLGPSPGWNDGCIKAMLKAVLRSRPDMRILDFVDDLRLTNVNPTRRIVHDDVTSVLEFGKKVGLIFHREGPKLIWETQIIDWVGFDVNTRDMMVSVTEKKKIKGLENAQEIIDSGQGNWMSAKRLAEIIGFLNFLTTIAQGGYVHLREGWNIIADCGIQMEWQLGKKADMKIWIPRRLVDDMIWWCQALQRGPWKRINRWEEEAFLWHPKLTDLPMRMMKAPEREIAVICTDASSLIGWGACWDEKTVQGLWTIEEKREHINWMELTAALRAISCWKEELRGKLILLKMDNQVAVSYVNYGAGRCKELTRVSERLTLLAIEESITVVAIWIAGEENTIADALSRYQMEMNWKQKPDERTLNIRARKVVRGIIGNIDVDMMCDAEGNNSLCKKFKSERNSAFEGDWEEGNLWWFPPRGMEGVVMKHIAKKSKRYPKSRCWMLIPDYVEKFGGESCREFDLKGVLRKNVKWFDKVDKGIRTELEHDRHDWWIIAVRYASGDSPSYVDRGLLRLRRMITSHRR